MYVCMYIYIYIFTCIYTIYIYIYICLSLSIIYIHELSNSFSIICILYFLVNIQIRRQMRSSALLRARWPRRVRLNIIMNETIQWILWIYEFTRNNYLWIYWLNLWIYEFMKLAYQFRNLWFYAKIINKQYVIILISDKLYAITNTH